MVKVSTDLHRKCITVSMPFGAGTTYLVDVRPEVANARFTASNIRNLNGKIVTGDIQYRLGALAIKEVFAWFKEKLEPPSHYQAQDMHDRVLRAFLVTLANTEESKRARLRPLDHSDVRLLTLAAGKMSVRIEKLKKDARAQRRKLVSGYVDDVKAGVLSELMNEQLLPRDRRDWYSRVLGLTFAWKAGRIPRNQYEESSRLLLGYNCLIGKDMEGPR